ncbi:glycosyltransferase family 4 protein [Methylobacter sp. BlB1]|uniref:glycosyltransferase family 4 protein n=1 Tax=Methylobacter sp. BlB1 TaxID=2785914 RepID=UPI001895D42B|nr:glycosyltransferase family 4 protein [Methylobacter sp. BlB1]MBF6650510.1 glycosyltransferase family 4 protein [Methylobacter sp. BlB1]
MIVKPYILFTRIPIVKTQFGRLFCDTLWAKDLSLHLDYISDFRICCPVVYSNDVQGLDDITGYNIRHIYQLRKDYGFGSVAMNLILNLVSVIKACNEASIVHSEGAGWAFPLSFYLFFLRPFYSFQWVIVIESSEWMLDKKYEKPTLRKLITHYVHKVILSNCIRQADARIFTQSFYRNFFLKGETDRTLIAPAIWIDKYNSVSTEVVKKRYLNRKGKTIRIVFPSRLIEEKGVFVLFDAIDLLKNMEVNVSITIMGTGKLEEKCKIFALKEYGNIKVTYHPPVKYSSEFFNVLCDYDLVLISNLKEEQPRIIFDAFSQGVGVIASDTSGILDVTVNGENAIIYKRGDPESLAKAIRYVVKNPDLILDMGINGLSYIEGKTHHQMHLERQQFFARVLDL